MSGFHVRLAEEPSREGACGEGSPSGDSSLAVSPLSTHRTNCESLASTGADSTKPAMSTLFAKVDISDLLAPLEQRLFERLDALEAMVDRRCGALECRVGVLTAATSDTAGFQQQLKVLQAQMEATMGSLQSYMEKEGVRITNLAENLRTCGEKQAFLQSNIDEVWRQLKADKKEMLANYQNLSDTLEPRLRGILEKVDRRCSDLGGLLTDDVGGRPGQDRAEEMTLGGRMTPAPSPTLQPRSEAQSPTGNSCPAPLLSVPASPQLQYRMSLQPTSPVAQQPSLGQAQQASGEADRVARQASSPILPLRMRSVDVPLSSGGCATPNNLAVRPAQQPVQRAPIQRMQSANRAHLAPEGIRSTGVRTAQAPGGIARSYKELPRP